MSIIPLHFQIKFFMMFVQVLLHFFILFLMQQTRSIFFPIKPQLQDQRIFAKRHTLYKKSFNSPFKPVNPPEDKQKPSKTRETYSSFKKKLEDYILKEKDRRNAQMYPGGPQNTSSKYRILFKKRHSTQHSRGNQSTIILPSDEMKHSFSQLIISSEGKQKGVNVISPQYYLKDQMPPNEEQKKERRIQYRHRKHIKQDQYDFKKSMKPLYAIFQAHRLRKRDMSSAATNSDKSILTRAITSQSQTEVIVCRGSKYSDIDELQYKKGELAKINIELKARNAVKYRLRKRAQQQKGNQVGPWSKTLPVDEDEI